MDPALLTNALAGLQSSPSETLHSGLDPTSKPPTLVPDPKPSTTPTPSGSSALALLLSTPTQPQFRGRVLGLDETDTPGRRIAIHCEAWIKAVGRNKRDRGTWLVISGPTGIGKSHALRRCRRFLGNHAVDFWAEGLWQSVPPVLFAAWSRVVELPKDEWDDWLYDLRRAAAVLLDDLGSEVDRFRSGEPAERLRVVLEECGAKWLAISTNVSPANWGAAFDGRAISRLNRAACLDLTGAKDYRPIIKGGA